MFLNAELLPTFLDRFLICKKVSGSKRSHSKRFSIAPCSLNVQLFLNIPNYGISLFYMIPVTKMLETTGNQLLPNEDKLISELANKTETNLIVLKF